MRNHCLILISSLLITGCSFSFAQAPGQNLAGIIYDLKTDWSDSQNPNGVWSYNDGNGPITNHVADYVPGVFKSQQPAWVYAATGPGHIVSWLKATSDGFNPCPDCGNTDWQVGDILTHTWDAVNGGPSTSPANVTWTSPSTGTIDIRGAVWLARNIGRAVDWKLTLNNQTLASGALFDGDPFSRSNPFDLAAGTNGSGPLVNLPVAPGDQVKLSFITVSSSGEYVGMNFAIEFHPCSPPVTIALSHVEICWPSLRGVTYQVQYRSEVAGGEWSNLPNGRLAGDGSTMCLTDRLTLPRRFYRVICASP